MTNGSINIDDIKGKVSGISYGSTGSLSAEVINIQGNLSIVVNNPTPEVIAELRKIQQAPIQASGTKDQGITTQKVKETRQSIDLFKNLVSKGDNKVGAPIQAIRAGNVEISRNELLSKDAGTMAYDYVQKGDYYAALEWSDKAIHIDPNNAITWLNKGVSLGKLGKRNESLQSFDRALRINPNDARSWDGIGNSLFSLGKFNEAIPCYDRALRLSLSRVDTTWREHNVGVIFSNKGAALDSLGKYREAIQMYDRALVVDPNNAIAWNNKGEALEKFRKT